MDYISYPCRQTRHDTRTVKIGDISIGGKHPVVIQSMLTSATNDVDACLKEIQSLMAVNCQLIRLTVPSMKDLEYVVKLRQLLKIEGITVPLVADVHFSPNIAVAACEFFEKVRINPGNYTDVSKNARRNKSASWFEEGREKLNQAIVPLVRQLKYYDRALRIGVNHGSLSTRMIEQYGDSPKGMVESALEMINLFESQGFDQLVVSLKSSNPIVVQKAYRLLVEKSPEKNAVPLHLGVTEAGSGVEGRVKGLAGIGSLLMDGIGDTIRVSLTEESKYEIIFAEKLLTSIENRRNPDHFIGEDWKRELSHQRIKNQSIIVGELEIGNTSPLKLGVFESFPSKFKNFANEFDFKFKTGEDQDIWIDDKRLLILPDNFEFGRYNENKSDGLILSGSLNQLYHLRSEYKKLVSGKPIGMFYPISQSEAETLYLETQISAILSEGLLDFLLIPDNISQKKLERAFYLLQATRSKMFFPDYIACPSCGRTLFDLQSATAKIKKATGHLKGVKIGIMGCIVNGPGEMADADFGYVGSGKGKIDLYLGQDKVKKNVDENEAVDELVNLIKENNRWVEEPRE
jgi:(E)-4-hydroxy-3-methylbut-2-enyl-diphosphate synthase